MLVATGSSCPILSFPHVPPPPPPLLLVLLLVVVLLWRRPVFLKECLGHALSVARFSLSSLLLIRPPCQRSLWNFWINEPINRVWNTTKQQPRRRRRRRKWEEINSGYIITANRLRHYCIETKSSTRVLTVCIQKEFLLRHYSISLVTSTNIPSALVLRHGHIETRNSRRYLSYW